MQPKLWDPIKENIAGGTCWANLSLQTAGDGNPSGCFIATAAHGDPNASDVQILRRFRDTFLLKFGAGQRLVNLYYRISTPMADYIHRHASLRVLTRVLLAPVVFTIQWPWATSVFYGPRPSTFPFSACWANSRKRCASSSFPIEAYIRLIF